MNLKVYKIRHKKTGLFSTGGMLPKWTKQGKTWTRLNYVHSHINQLRSDYTPADIYKDAEVVMAEIAELIQPVEDAKDWLIKSYNEDIETYQYYLDRSKDDPYYSKHIANAKARRDVLL